MSAVPPAIRLSGITKRFGTVLANDAVDLEVAPGSIHGIIGENGAGKSTLMSILYGFYTADAGTIEIHGAPVEIATPADAIACGIGMVHQHFMLVPTFTVIENVMLGAEGGPLLSKGRAAVRQDLESLSRDYDLDVDPDALVGELPVGLQQRVEIIKALSRGARILIFDEPTGVLTPDETARLFEILRGLAAQGVSIILITHKLQEIMAITDTVSVMRGGRMVAHRKTPMTGREELAQLMVGREVNLKTMPRSVARGEALLEAEGISWRDPSGVLRLKDVSLQLNAGEVLGLAGVSGNGQSELLDVLAGIKPLQQGHIRVLDHRIGAGQGYDPARARNLGLAHVPEDRHRRGLVLPFKSYENAVLGYTARPLKGLDRWLRPSALKRHCDALMTRFDVRPPVSDLKAVGFSGGNQQKQVLAREIEAKPQILLIGQPTRGVDIGAIEEIHRRIEELKASGCAILLVSVELEEILALSDRIAVMADGRITGTLSRADADAGRLGLLMAGEAA